MDVAVDLELDGNVDGDVSGLDSVVYSIFGQHRATRSLEGQHVDKVGTTA